MSENRVKNWDILLSIFENELYNSVINGDWKIYIEMANKKGIKLRNIINKINGSTPLIEATKHEYRMFVNDMLMRDGKYIINVSDSNGWTSLHWCCINGNFGICKQLLISGANPNIDTSPIYPIHLAILYKHFDILKLLIEYNADKNVKLSGYNCIQLVKQLKMLSNNDCNNISNIILDCNKYNYKSQNNSNNDDINDEYGCDDELDTFQHLKQILKVTEPIHDKIYIELDNNSDIKTDNNIEQTTQKHNINTPILDKIDMSLFNISETHDIDAIYQSESINYDNEIKGNDDDNDNIDFDENELANILAKYDLGDMDNNSDNDSNNDSSDNDDPYATDESEPENNDNNNENNIYNDDDEVNVDVIDEGSDNDNSYIDNNIDIKDDADDVTGDNIDNDTSVKYIKYHEIKDIMQSLEDKISQINTQITNQNDSLNALKSNIDKEISNINNQSKRNIEQYTIDVRTETSKLIKSEMIQVSKNSQTKMMNDMKQFVKDQMNTTTKDIQNEVLLLRNLVNKPVNTVSKVNKRRISEISIKTGEVVEWITKELSHDNDSDNSSNNSSELINDRPTITSNSTTPIPMIPPSVSNYNDDEMFASAFSDIEQKLDHNKSPNSTQSMQSLHEAMNQYVSNKRKKKNKKHNNTYPQIDIILNGTKHINKKHHKSHSAICTTSSPKLIESHSPETSHDDLIVIPLTHSISVPNKKKDKTFSLLSNNVKNVGYLDTNTNGKQTRSCSLDLNMKTSKKRCKCKKKQKRRIHNIYNKDNNSTSSMNNKFHKTGHCLTYWE